MLAEYPQLLAARHALKRTISGCRLGTRVQHYATKDFSGEDGLNTLGKTASQGTPQNETRWSFLPRSLDEGHVRPSQHPLRQPERKLLSRRPLIASSHGEQRKLDPRHSRADSHPNSQARIIRRYPPGSPVSEQRAGAASTDRPSRSREDSTRNPKAALQQPTSPDFKHRPAAPRSTLLRHHYEPQPKPINCTTFQSTKTFLADPCHPLHIKAQRNAENFDPSILHWRVHVIPDISKKAAIRDNAKNRIKNAFKAELKSRDLGWDGRARKEKGRGEGVIGEGEWKELRGALLMIVTRDAHKALNFTEQQARESVKFVLNQVETKLEQSESREQRREKYLRRDSDPRRM